MPAAASHTRPSVGPRPLRLRPLLATAVLVLLLQAPLPAAAHPLLPLPILDDMPRLPSGPNMTFVTAPLPWLTVNISDCDPAVSKCALRPNSGPPAASTNLDRLAAQCWWWNDTSRSVVIDEPTCNRLARTLFWWVPLAVTVCVAIVLVPVIFLGLRYGLDCCGGQRPNYGWWCRDPNAAAADAADQPPPPLRVYTRWERRGNAIAIGVTGGIVVVLAFVSMLHGIWMKKTMSDNGEAPPPLTTTTASRFILHSILPLSPRPVEVAPVSSADFEIRPYINQMPPPMRLLLERVGHVPDYYAAEMHRIVHHNSEHAARYIVLVMTVVSLYAISSIVAIIAAAGKAGCIFPGVQWAHAWLAAAVALGLTLNTLEFEAAMSQCDAYNESFVPAAVGKINRDGGCSSAVQVPCDDTKKSRHANESAGDDEDHVHENDDGYELFKQRDIDEHMFPLPEVCRAMDYLCHGDRSVKVSSVPLMTCSIIDFTSWERLCGSSVTKISLYLGAIKAAFDFDEGLNYLTFAHSKHSEGKLNEVAQYVLREYKATHLLENATADALRPAALEYVEHCSTIAWQLEQFRHRSIALQQAANQIETNDKDCNEVRSFYLHAGYKSMCASVVDRDDHFQMRLITWAAVFMGMIQIVFIVRGIKRNNARLHAKSVHAAATLSAGNTLDTTAGDSVEMAPLAPLQPQTTFNAHAVGDLDALYPGGEHHLHHHGGGEHQHGGDDAQGEHQDAQRRVDSAGGQRAAGVAAAVNDPSLPPELRSALRQQQSLLIVDGTPCGAETRAVTAASPPPAVGLSTAATDGRTSDMTEVALNGGGSAAPTAAASMPPADVAKPHPVVLVSQGVNPYFAAAVPTPATPPPLSPSDAAAPPLLSSGPLHPSSMVPSSMPSHMTHVTSLPTMHVPPAASALPSAAPSFAPGAGHSVVPDTSSVALSTEEERRYQELLVMQAAQQQRQQALLEEYRRAVEEQQRLQEMMALHTSSTTDLHDGLSRPTMDAAVSMAVSAPSGSVVIAAPADPRLPPPSAAHQSSSPQQGSFTPSSPASPTDPMASNAQSSAPIDGQIDGRSAGPHIAHIDPQARAAAAVSEAAHSAVSISAAAVIVEDAPVQVEKGTPAELPQEEDQPVAVSVPSPSALNQSTDDHSLPGALVVNGDVPVQDQDEFSDAEDDASSVSTHGGVV